MMWPSSQASKILTFLLFTIVVFCISMDTFLFLRIQNYKIDTFDVINNGSQHETSTYESAKLLDSYEDVTWIPCTINPLCHPTVKALMVDHINHYIYGPLCSIIDIGLGISDNMPFLTPNMISFSHVIIAILGETIDMFESSMA